MNILICHCRSILLLATFLSLACSNSLHVSKDECATRLLFYTIHWDVDGTMNWGPGYRPDPTLDPLALRAALVDARNAWKYGRPPAPTVELEPNMTDDKALGQRRSFIYRSDDAIRVHLFNGSFVSDWWIWRQRKNKCGSMDYWLSGGLSDMQDNAPGFEVHEGVWQEMEKQDNPDLLEAARRRARR
jgi:hypothetical protein